MRVAISSVGEGGRHIRSFTAKRYSTTAGRCSHKFLQTIYLEKTFF